MTRRPLLAAAPRARRADDDGVAVIIVVMCMVVSLGLVIGVLGVLTSELLPTAYERKSQRTIAASQAGLQAGLAAVRQAWTGTSNGAPLGDSSKLPCYPVDAPLTGDVGGLGPGQPPVGYAVTVTYYTVSPKGQSADWRAHNLLACVPGAGTSVTPVYALVQAQATSVVGAVPAGWGDRSSELVYMINRTDQAVLGGPIHSDLISTTTKTWCWEAAAYPPVAGTAVTLQTCVAGKPAQTWSYRSDYSIVLSGTQTSSSPPSGGFCINADADSTSGNTYAVSLQPCVQGQWNQLWAYNDSGEMQGVDANKSRLVNTCLTTNGAFVAGAQLTVANCDPSKDNWTPDATVGAGAAGVPTTQLVNYGEYGRCLDITNWNLDATWLIDYPCKQDPTSLVGWNQRWVWDGAGTRQVVSNTSHGAYCLTTPAAAGAYVVVRPCDATRDDQRWSMLGDTGNRSTSYTVLDSAGLCLALGPPGPGRADLSSWSSITVATCDGSFTQKWNSPPLPIGGNVAGERETTGGR